jgi:hypothetical protein
MMKRFFNWQMVLALILLGISALFYLLHYAVFHDVHHIFLYLIGDIAFLFVDVLIVMLVLHRLLVYREKQVILKKLNMVIGAFFIEVGTELLRRFSEFDTGFSVLKERLIVTGGWADRDFAKARSFVQTHQSGMNPSAAGLSDIRDFLTRKKDFLLDLLANPNLLEHDAFTNLLWAVFHLTDELSHRQDLGSLPEADRQHLSGDIQRAYRQLALQWLEYMKHLKKDYPYLFSLALRTNPFDAEARVEVNSF